MEFVIGVLAVLFVIFVTLGIMLTVRTARAVRRGVERTGSQVRRTVEETGLKAKSAQPGPVGQVARLRLELRASIDHTRGVLDAGADDDPSLREALGLLDRLHEHARQLDGELRLLMEREPDRARVAERLPEARERVASIKESADSLRFAAQERARDYDTTDSLGSLREQIEIESGALRGWRDPAQPRAGAAEAEEGPPRSGRSVGDRSAPAAPGESVAAVEEPAAHGGQRPVDEAQRDTGSGPAALTPAQEPTLPDAVSQALDPRARWEAGDPEAEPSGKPHDLRKGRPDSER
ncbi:hypothetical protein [Streptomyces oceani]|uniref:hypothetical protein n=1 Tax=Streptomyces oceani TaxID=1075402 RepID=UPI0008733C71|nr:hypothetical protein [Streptomyces oceani]